MIEEEMIEEVALDLNVDKTFYIKKCRGGSASVFLISAKNDVVADSRTIYPNHFQTSKFLSKTRKTIVSKNQ